MILWTIFPMEMVLADSDKVTGPTQLTRNGIMLEVENHDGRQYRITRIISTNPMDYLNPALQPGQLIY